MGEKPNILIVDDDESNLLLMEYLLGKEKYTTVTATNAEKALQIVSEKQIDIILSDVMMPGMNGFEFTKEIRKNPKTRLIPIVLLTGLEEVQYRIQGIEAGCDDFITKPSVDFVNKPFYKEEVLSRVKMLLQMNFYRLQIDEKEKFDLLLNGLGDGYILLDKDGFIEKNNIIVREWLIMPDEQVKVSFLSQVRKHFNFEEEENIIETMPYYNLSFEIERPKTSQFEHLILECRSFPFREEYQVKNILILLHDVTVSTMEDRSRKEFFVSLANRMKSHLRSNLLEEGKLEMALQVKQLEMYTLNLHNTSSLLAKTIHLDTFLQEMNTDFKELFQEQSITLIIDNNLNRETIRIRDDLLRGIFIELILMSINHQSKKAQKINLKIRWEKQWLACRFENYDFKDANQINRDSVIIIKNLALLLKGRIEMDVQEESGSLFILQIPAPSTQKKEVKKP